MQHQDLENKIDRSFEDPRLEHEVKLDLIRSLDNLTAINTSADELSHVYDNLMYYIDTAQRTDRRHRRIKLFSMIASRAAIFVLGIISALVIWRLWASPVDQESPLTVIAPSNAVSQAILPDGSKIFLNANSKLTYVKNSASHEREAVLEGEAWFEVTKNSEMPFTVKTSAYKIRVHGTAFNVRSFDPKHPSVTTLQHGSIEILPLDDRKNSVRPLFLTPGQEYIFDPATDQVHISKVDGDLASLWKENEIKFENKNFRDLLKILEGRYQVQFDVKDPELFDYHYDGTIRNETLTAVLDILRLTLPFQYRVKANGIIEIKK
ncbi:FecR family protein [Sphingobacterium yanglingense]|uniref:FecR family protein n=1 Tax=Sphingobacterium yanglingense TaxID=1437280 RepID=A0A4R6WMN2_9SPHI|nr:FecR domain-containing protein [Sphingobacterium yanglingense]TDQ80042.1 FecR family protein [Sphingobacterium yanglingense]